MMLPRGPGISESNYVFVGACVSTTFPTPEHENFKRIDWRRNGPNIFSPDDTNLPNLSRHFSAVRFPHVFRTSQRITNQIGSPVVLLVMQFSECRCGENYSPTGENVERNCRRWRLYISTWVYVQLGILKFDRNYVTILHDTDMYVGGYEKAGHWCGKLFELNVPGFRAALYSRQAC